MGKKLGVTATGLTTEKTASVYVAPKEDQVEDINLVCKLSCVKKLFQQLRDKSMETMKSGRCVSPAGPGPFYQIWTKIDDLAKPVYNDLNILNELIEDKYGDFENPGKHCSVTHEPLDPAELGEKICSFKSIIQQGVIDVMTNQALLPKKGLNILDSMFNQLWELGEKGPGIVIPSWCQEAIDSINKFEDSMIDAWDEVFDCWEREFLTRLWSIELEHHTSNYERTQTKYVQTTHNHQHIVDPLTFMALASVTGDSKNMDITPLKGVLTCPGHLEKLMKPVCIQYRMFNIAHLARHYRSDIKSLCQWMTSAIEAIGIKFAAISTVMSDPSLNGKCCNNIPLAQINELREKNNELLTKVEKAYGLYSNVDNMKNKKEYDEEIALHELQPNKYSNEDQLNISSSIQSESNQLNLDGKVCKGGIMKELQPWNHMSLKENKVTPKCIPSKCVCNKFDKVIESVSGFESWTIEN